MDVHIGAHMLEAHVFTRASRKNIRYLAHIIRKQGGHLFRLSKDHKATPVFLMDVHVNTSEKAIIQKMPKRGPFTILLRFNAHADHGFVGGGEWMEPEYVAAHHGLPQIF